jgi:hypothetical protein
MGVLLRLLLLTDGTPPGLECLCCSDHQKEESGDDISLPSHPGASWVFLGFERVPGSP